MKLSILSIADYAAVRPDATLDIVRGGQALFVVPEGAVALTRAIAFQVFLDDAELGEAEWPVRVTIHDSEGTIVGGAETKMPSPGSTGTPEGDIPLESRERYPAPGVLNAELAIPTDGEFQLTLSVAGKTLGEQWFTVVHLPDGAAEPMPDEVVAAVRGLTED